MSYRQYNEINVLCFQTKLYKCNMTCDDDEDDVLILKVKYELVWCIGAVSYKNTKKKNIY